LQTTKPEILHINYKFVNGNNQGSLLSNKEIHVCYCMIDIDLIKSKMKKIIGCFINPNDLVLDKTNVDKYIYYFQLHRKLDYLFNIADLLNNTLYSQNYNSSIIQRILKENSDVTIRKIITKCENTLKEKILIS
jgi:hypothetical protein